ncbi:hypothetical protein SFUMM280S_03666 [Streptomyces fumanus]
MPLGSEADTVMVKVFFAEVPTTMFLPPLTVTPLILVSPTTSSAGDETANGVIFPPGRLALGHRRRQ